MPVAGALWGDASTALSLLAICMGLTGRLSWKGFFALQLGSQMLWVQALVMGGSPLLDIGQQCGWLVVSALLWNRHRT